MKKILILLMAILSFSCKKDNIDIKGTMDLKGLSLPQLKTFLKGKWQWQYAVIYNFGGFADTIRHEGSKAFLIFSAKDSVLQRNETLNITIREKLIYDRLEIPGDPDGKSAFILKFNDDGYGFLNMWVADKLVNDTLVFVNYFRSEGFNSYHFTKE